MIDDAQREKILKELRTVSRVMDSSIGIPGTKFTFGVDSLIGLIPAGGDLAGLVISLYLVARARQLGLPKGLLAKMIGNILVDAGLGTVPILGDAFDFFFKANSRNIDLLLKSIPDSDQDSEEHSG